MPADVGKGCIRSVGPISLREQSEAVDAAVLADPSAVYIPVGWFSGGRRLVRKEEARFP